MRFRIIKLLVVLMVSLSTGADMILLLCMQSEWRWQSIANWRASYSELNVQAYPDGLNCQFCLTNAKRYIWKHLMFRGMSFGSSTWPKKVTHDSTHTRFSTHVENVQHVHWHTDPTTTPIHGPGDDDYDEYLFVSWSEVLPLFLMSHPKIELTQRTLLLSALIYFSLVQDVLCHWLCHTEMADYGENKQLKRWYLMQLAYG